MRYAKLAAELGLGQKDMGVEAEVAMRNGHWDEAKRLFEKQEGIPEGDTRPIGPIVDALADPAMRPRMVATLQAIDPKVCRSRSA